MKFIQFRIGDIVQMKKKHPCGSQEWEVLQLGSDMRHQVLRLRTYRFDPSPQIFEGGEKSPES